MGFSFNGLKDFLSTKGDYEEYEEEQVIEEEEGFDDISNNSGFDYEDDVQTQPRASASNGFSFRRKPAREPQPAQDTYSRTPNFNSAPADDYSYQRRNTARESNNTYQAPSYSAPVNEAPRGSHSAAGNANIKCIFPTSLAESIDSLVEMVMSDSIVIFGLDNCPNPEDRRKMILFTAGIVFAKNGHFFRPRQDLFIVIPDGVTVEGKLHDILKEEGFVTD